MTRADKLLLLLLCGDAQLQHGALFLLGDGIAQKADVYQQRQHTAKDSLHQISQQYASQGNQPSFFH